MCSKYGSISWWVIQRSTSQKPGARVDRASFLFLSEYYARCRLLAPTRRQTYLPISETLWLIGNMATQRGEMFA